MLHILYLTDVAVTLAKIAPVITNIHINLAELSPYVAVESAEFNLRVLHSACFAETASNQMQNITNRILSLEATDPLGSDLSKYCDLCTYTRKLASTVTSERDSLEAFRTGYLNAGAGRPQ